MKRFRQILGVKGERVAVQFLRQRGFKIITRNFSCRFGEIDIIALQEKTTVFIEVKTRSSGEFGLPQDSIRAKKIKHLLRCAQFYIKNYANPEEDFRFDVVAIVFGDILQIQLIKDAF